MGLSLSVDERGRVPDALNVDEQVSRVDVRGSDSLMWVWGGKGDGRKVGMGMGMGLGLGLGIGFCVIDSYHF